MFKIFEMLFAFVENYRKVNDLDDNYRFQSWERGLVSFTASHNYENHTANETAMIEVFGNEILYMSLHLYFNQREPLQVWLFGKQISGSP